LRTAEANAVVLPVHDPMPVLLGHGDFGRWLAPGAAPSALLGLLRPAPDALPVSAFVNSARHEGPRCVGPVSAPSQSD
jgi:putative SOS response-associated peptidase YedK